MAAALYLHNAIFTTEPASPPSVAHTHRSPNRRVPHDRQLSSVSSVTLQTSTSEHSHPTEPLIHPGSSESTVYLDLLARQPTHPSSPAGRTQGLSLQGDPVTPRERRIQHERVVRRRLKRLRLVQRVLWVIIGEQLVHPCPSFPAVLVPIGARACVRSSISRGSLEREAYRYRPEAPQRFCSGSRRDCERAGVVVRASVGVRGPSSERLASVLWWQSSL